MKRRAEARAGKWVLESVRTGLKPRGEGSELSDVGASCCSAESVVSGLVCFDGFVRSREYW